MPDSCLSIQEVCHSVPWPAHGLGGHCQLSAVGKETGIALCPVGDLRKDESLK
jgi:hypothetical protein